MTLSKNLELFAGKKILQKRISKTFDNLSVEFLDMLSKELLQDRDIRKFPDLATFAFWARKKNIINISKKYISKDELRVGLGTVFHITPSNMPVNFMYSFAFGLLSGNSNVVRVSEKKFIQAKIFFKYFKKLGNKKKFIPIYQSNIFCNYPKDNLDVSKYFSMNCDARIIWGSDDTVKNFSKISTKPKTKIINFPERYSICAINLESLKKIKKNEFKKLILNFYNDTYLNDQNACTSPQMIIWVGKMAENLRNNFWKELEKIVRKNYKLEEIVSIKKYSNLLSDILLKDKYFKKIYKHENYIYRILLRKFSNIHEMSDFKGKWGYFFELQLKKLEEILSITNHKIQTLSYYGFKKKNLKKMLENNKFEGIDRIVPVGRTLDMDVVWDGFDLPNTLSRIIEIK